MTFFTIKVIGPARIYFMWKRKVGCTTRLPGHAVCRRHYNFCWGESVDSSQWTGERLIVAGIGDENVIREAAGNKSQNPSGY
jgi:hypothetical protein